MANGPQEERDRRLALWQRLRREVGTEEVDPSELNERRIYRGQQGVYRDTEATRGLTEAGTGVTVGLLHTGRQYPDELAEDGLIYHYPDTDRPGDADRNEIEGTKAAGRLQLPVFVVLYPHPEATRRNVELGWVIDWDDEAQQFLVQFGDQPLDEKEPEEDFSLKKEGRGATVSTERRARSGQADFKFAVTKRYGEQCAFCDVDIPELLDAAHLCPKQAGGSDDPRNGLILCALHHRALDAGLLGIEPETLEVIVAEEVSLPLALELTKPNLRHLQNSPHPEALEWRWKQWKG